MTSNPVNCFGCDRPEIDCLCHIAARDPMQNDQYGKVHTDGSRSGGQPRNPADVQDIVERLRRYSVPDGIGGDVRPIICSEAADEIERLRAALQQSRSAVVEQCAKVAEQYQCRACEVWFHPKDDGHEDEDCAKGRASWDQPERDIAAPIRALGD